MTVVTDLFRRLRLPACLLGTAALLALAACGGGQRVNDFEPQRVLVFGDETSVIGAGGARYTVNGLVEGGSTIDCQTNRIWVQLLAARAGFGFPECPLEGEAAPVSRIYAAVGTGVADVALQVDAFLADPDAGGPFKTTDLVTVLTGQKDIIDFYGTVTSMDQCRFVAGDADRAGAVALQARERGRVLAQQIERIAAGGRGGRVLFVTVPGVGYTPFGREPSDVPGVDKATCLNELTEAFNSGLRVKIQRSGLTGSDVGLVQLEELVNVVVEEEEFGFANTSTAACTAALPDCTTETLIDGDPDTAGVQPVDHTTYLWADDRHFGTTMHNALGVRAIDRAFETNPF